MKKSVENRYLFRCYEDIAILFDKVNKEYVVLQDIFADMFRIMMNERDDQSYIVQQILNAYNIDKETVENDVREYYSIIYSLVKAPERKCCEDHLSTTYDETEEYIFEMMSKRRIPFTATIEITDLCNLSCIHCYRTQKSTGNWSLEQFKEVLRQLKELGTLHLVFAGSEPLMHPMIVDFVNVAREFGFVISIQTNAVLLNQDLLNAMDNCVIKNIFVSLYSGDQSIHDAITGQQGSYNKTIKAIKALVKRGYDVHASISIFKNNKEQVRSVKKLCDDLGVRPGFNFKIIPALDKAKDTQSLNCFDEKDMLQYILDPEIQLYREEIKKCFENAEKKIDRYCDTGFRSITITYDYYVVICNSYRKKCGNIREKSIIDIWNKSETLVEWRTQGSLVNAKCRNCDAFQFCEPCPAHQYSIDGDDNRVDDITCQYGKMFFRTCQEVKKTGIL